MTECLIALGGNMGHVETTFSAALDRLDIHPAIDVVAVSRCFLTDPVGADAGDPYLNAAAAVSTSLEPPALLEATKQVEVELGRTRDHVVWAPRTVDLDLITFGTAVFDLDRLRIPHPGCWYRRFVLDPICRIAASTQHPLRGVSFATLRDRLLARPLPVWISTPDRDARIAELMPLFPDIDWVDNPEATRSAGLVLPGTSGNPTPPDSWPDVLTAALGGVELAEEIPGWPERVLGSSRQR